MTTIFGYNRRRLPIGAMSNKFALSDMKRYARKRFNFIAGFTGK